MQQARMYLIFLWLVAMHSAGAEEEGGEDKHKEEKAAYSMGLTMLGMLVLITFLYHLTHAKRMETRELAWKMLSGTISIFIGVVLYSSFNDVFNEYICGGLFNLDIDTHKGQHWFVVINRFWVLTFYALFIFLISEKAKMLPECLGGGLRKRLNLLEGKKEEHRGCCKKWACLPWNWGRHTSLMENADHLEGNSKLKSVLSSMKSSLFWAHAIGFAGIDGWNQTQQSACQGKDYNGQLAASIWLIAQALVKYYVVFRVLGLFWRLWMKKCVEPTCYNIITSANVYHQLPLRSEVQDATCCSDEHDNQYDYVLKALPPRRELLKKKDHDLLVNQVRAALGRTKMENGELSYWLDAKGRTPESWGKLPSDWFKRVGEKEEEEEGEKNKAQEFEKTCCEGNPKLWQYKYKFEEEEEEELEDEIATLTYNKYAALDKENYSEAAKIKANLDELEKKKGMQRPESHRPDCYFQSLKAPDTNKFDAARWWQYQYKVGECFAVPEYDELAEQWEDIRKDGENDFFGLFVSFLTVQTLRLAFSGYLPNKEEDEDLFPDSEEGGHSLVQALSLYGAAFVCLCIAYKVYAALVRVRENPLFFDKGTCGYKVLSVIRYLEPPIMRDELHEHLERVLDILTDVLCMTASWCVMYGTQWWLARWQDVTKLDESVLTVMLAITVTFAMFMALQIADIVLMTCGQTIKKAEEKIRRVSSLNRSIRKLFSKQDRRPSKLSLSFAVSQKKLKQSHKGAFTKINTSVGLLIGFAWEANFDEAVENIAENISEDHPVFVKFACAVIFILLLLPVWRNTIIPMSEEQGYKFGFVPRNLHARLDSMHADITHASEFLPDDDKFEEDKADRGKEHEKHIEEHLPHLKKISDFLQTWHRNSGKKLKKKDSEKPTRTPAVWMGTSAPSVMSQAR